MSFPTVGSPSPPSAVDTAPAAMTGARRGPTFPTVPVGVALAAPTHAPAGGDTSPRSGLLDDHSHGPTIMLSISNVVGFTYVDGSRADSDAGAGIEISRTDGDAVELTTPEEVDALVEALGIARREIWGNR